MSQLFLQYTPLYRECQFLYTYGLLEGRPQSTISIKFCHGEQNDNLHYVIFLQRRHMCYIFLRVKKGGKKPDKNDN